MNVVPVNPPRVFAVGDRQQIELRDCARVSLEPDEQVTFVTDAGAEYDLTRKSWGFYATPSTNGRLLRFGLRTALVQNRRGQYFVLLVEAGREALFDAYAADERLQVLCWLDGSTPAPCLFCGGARFSRTFVYEAPPAGEVRFELASGTRYHREFHRCDTCGHFVAIHDLDLSGLYERQYVSATYGDDGLRQAFERIQALPAGMSDNAGRVERIVRAASEWITAPTADNGAPTVLDVGSGLCVFLDRLKQAGWRCTAVDPDPRAAAHARDVVGVEAHAGDFMTTSLDGRFDVIAFNKVLEHVHDPVTMLARSATFLNPGGFVYVEVPDGEAASLDGPHREEFFVEHHHVFSAASLALLARRAGFSVRALERLREPSTKYTLRAFCVVGDRPSV